MADLMEALWDLILGRRILRWFFIGLLAGLVLVSSMIWSGSDMDAGDAVMAILASGVLIFGARVVYWLINR